MSVTPEKSDYLLFFRGNDWEKNLPPEELKKVVTDWYAWFQRLAAEGKCLGGLSSHTTCCLPSPRSPTTVSGPHH